MVNQLFLFQMTLPDTDLYDADFDADAEEKQ